MAESFDFKVNGVQISTDNQVLTALEILVLAREKDAIPGDPSTYILQGEKGEYSGADSVDLKQDSIFIAIPDAPTPVA